MIFNPPQEPLRTFQNAIVEREKMSKSKNNKSGDTVSAGDPEEQEVETASDVDVVVGESSKSFGGKGDNVAVEATKSGYVRTELISGKGKGKEISSQEW